MLCCFAEMFCSARKVSNAVSFNVFLTDSHLQDPEINNSLQNFYRDKCLGLPSLLVATALPQQGTFLSQCSSFHNPEQAESNAK